LKVLFSGKWKALIIRNNCSSWNHPSRKVKKLAKRWQPNWKRRGANSRPSKVIRAAKTFEEQNSSVEQFRLEARIQQMQAAQAESEQQVKSLKEALTVETERATLSNCGPPNTRGAGANSRPLGGKRADRASFAAAMEASENAKRWGELETELAENKTGASTVAARLG